jgi:hypothetical protein
MKSTKRTRARKRTTTDKRRKNWGDPILDKLMQLKYLINDAYNSRQENDGETKSDKSWVMEEIHNLRNEGWLTATKMKVANEMWSKYAK